MFDTLVTYGSLALQIAIIVLGAAAAVLHIIAPLTKSQGDDKALGWVRRALVFVTAVLGKLMPKAPTSSAGNGK